MQQSVGDGAILAAGDVYINKKETHKNLVATGPDHIRDDQAFRLKELIDELAKIGVTAGREPSSCYSEWNGKLRKKFRVTSYRLIPAVRFEEAVQWLQKQKAMLRPKLRRRDNSQWRNAIYSGIWSRTKQLGMSKEQVHELATSYLERDQPVTSLKDLQEGELDKLRAYIFRLPR